MIAERLPALLGAYPRCEVEIGCGNGHFLAAYGSSRRDTLLIGIETKEKRCLAAERKVDRLGLGNVVIVRGQAETVIRELPTQSIDAFHCYFPDPWPKSRHRQRRFLTMRALRMLHRRLKPGGTVFFCSDFFDYSVQAKVLFLLHPGFTLSTDRAPGEVFLSVYSRKFADYQKPIYFLSAVSTASTDDQGHEDEDGEVVNSQLGDDQ